MALHEQLVALPDLQPGPLAGRSTVALSSLARTGASRRAQHATKWHPQAEVANMAIVPAPPPTPAPGPDGLHLRRATAADIEGIAALHVENWRRGYRGAFSDAYLDGDIESDRLRVWSGRLDPGGPGPGHEGAAVVLADAGEAVQGFAYVIFDEHPRWGALLENLHVRLGLQGHGWGRSLIRAAAAVTVEHDPASGFHLEVLDQNVAAQGFYDRLGGVRVESYPWVPPGGGSTTSHRYAWPDPSVLLAD